MMAIFTPMFLYNEYHSITTLIELSITISISLLYSPPLGIIMELYETFFLDRFLLSFL